MNNLRLILPLVLISRSSFIAFLLAYWSVNLRILLLLNSLKDYSISQLSLKNKFIFWCNCFYSTKLVYSQNLKNIVYQDPCWFILFVYVLLILACWFVTRMASRIICLAKNPFLWTANTPFSNFFINASISSLRASAYIAFSISEIDQA